MSFSAQELIDLMERIEPQYQESCRKAEIRIAREIKVRWQVWIHDQATCRRFVKRGRRLQRRYGAWCVLYTGV